MADTFLAAMATVDNAILNALGETVTVKDTLGASVGSVVGIFEKQFVEAFDLQGYFPTFTYQDTDLLIEEGYEIAIDAALFIVRVKQPDGTGVSFLILREK